MKSKKIGKRYELLFVKRDELVQYKRNPEELSVVQEDVLQDNLLKTDACYYCYITTQREKPEDTCEYKGYVVVRRQGTDSGEAKATGIFDFNALSKDIAIQDIIKILDKISSMCIDRDFPILKFEHGGRKEYITAAKKLGFDTKSNALTAITTNGVDMSVIAAAVL